VILAKIEEWGFEEDPAATSPMFRHIRELLLQDRFQLRFVCEQLGRPKLQTKILTGLVGLTEGESSGNK